MADNQKKDSKRRTIGEAANTPDSTQVPWNAERGEPDWQATSAGQRGGNTESDRSAQSSGPDADEDEQNR